jgi:hypothetical protein
VAGFLPEWLAPVGWLPFNFVLRREGREVGTYRRVLGKLRDRYLLEVTPDLADVDRRLLVAFAVGPRCRSGPVAGEDRKLRP